MRKIKKIGLYFGFTLAFAIGFHIIISGLELTFKEREKRTTFQLPEIIRDVTNEGIVRCFLPTFAYQKEERILPKFLPALLFEKCNLAEFVVEREVMKDKENEIEVTRITEEEAALAEDLRIWEEEGDEGYFGNVIEENLQAEPANTENKSVEAAASPIQYSMEQLQSYDFLLQNLYTVDKTTSINNSELRGGDLISRSLKVDKNVEGPIVLIYHTHSQELYADSDASRDDTGILSVGAYLKQILEEQYGIKTLHVTSRFDVVDGKLDRNKAYSQALKEISRILSENPSIQIVIDLHRDGVKSGTHLVTDVNGKKTAQIMFFNGLSRTNATGDIAYLKNPYLQDNLALSLQMKVKADSEFPNFARRIYLKGYRYNLHLSKRAMLVEVGAQTNTVEEAKNAMEPLAKLMSEVLFP